MLKFKIMMQLENSEDGSVVKHFSSCNNENYKGIAVDIASAVKALGFPRKLAMLAEAIEFIGCFEGVGEEEQELYLAAENLVKYWNDHDAKEPKPCCNS